MDAWEGGKMERLVAGHLQKKNGYWYAVITFKQEGKPTSKWINTRFKKDSEKGKAETFLILQRIKYTELLYGSEAVKLPEDMATTSLKKTESHETSQTNSFSRYSKEMTMVEFCEVWRTHVKHAVEETTFYGYMNILRNHIIPFFEKHNVEVGAVNNLTLEEYINYAYDKGLANKTVNNHKGVLSGIFEYARTLKLIEKNPVSEVSKIPKTPPVENYYSEDELKILLRSCISTTLEFPIFMACIYALRRSEVCGLRWTDIDMMYDTFTVWHVRTSMTGEDNRSVILSKDRTKNKVKRVYPIISTVKMMLTRIRNYQIELGIYNPNGYIFVDSNAAPRRPDYITEKFPQFLETIGLKRIRFQDLRHSCASVLLQNKKRQVTLVDIQNWLGHLHLQSTMRYAHMSRDSSREYTAGVIGNILPENIEAI